MTMLGIPANRLRFSGCRDAVPSDVGQQREWQIVQSRLTLDDFSRAPWKGAPSLRVQIPPGNCRSSR